MAKGTDNITRAANHVFKGFTEDDRKTNLYQSLSYAITTFEARRSDRDETHKDANTRFAFNAYDSLIEAVLKADTDKAHNALDRFKKYYWIDITTILVASTPNHRP